jgi:hypothetical protein
MQLIFQLTTANGKINCARCQAMSKRTHQQCGAPAERGKRVCRFHGARSSGPKTEAGRLRIARSKTKTGQYSREALEASSASLSLIRQLEDAMHLLAMTSAPRTRGRKPRGYAPLLLLADVAQLALENPLHQPVRLDESHDSKSD